jgi:hypothetical protein
MIHGSDELSGLHSYYLELLTIGISISAVRDNICSCRDGIIDRGTIDTVIHCELWKFSFDERLMACIGPL